MMYANKFAIAVKNNGSIMREHGDTVYLPFGSEYSLILNNLNTEDALVKVSIDGVNVLDFNSLIIRANTSINLNGFMKGAAIKNKFKFIEKTEEIENYRGNKIEDGLIKVEFQFTKKVINQPVINTITYYPSNPSPSWDYYRYAQGSTSVGLDNIINNSNSSFSCTTSNLMSGNFSSHDTLTNYSNKSTINDDGITVKGTKINEEYSVGTIGELDNNKYSLILRIKGKTKMSNTIVSKPITVKEKIRCSTCGRKSKSYAIYCSNCGTCLD